MHAHRQTLAPVHAVIQPLASPIQTIDCAALVVRQGTGTRANVATKRRSEMRNGTRDRPQTEKNRRDERDTTLKVAHPLKQLIVQL